MSDSNSGSGNGLKRARSNSPVNGASSNGNGGKKQNTGRDGGSPAPEAERGGAGRSASPAEDGDYQAAPAAAPAEASPSITIRALIVTQDASVIIGKGGSHIKEIREKAGAKVSVTEAQPNTLERVLMVSGPLDAVSKAYGLIVRKINDEPYDQPSVPGSRAVTIKSARDCSQAAIIAY